MRALPPLSPRRITRTPLTLVSRRSTGAIHPSGPRRTATVPSFGLIIIIGHHHDDHHDYCHDHGGLVVLIKMSKITSKLMKIMRILE